MDNINILSNLNSQLRYHRSHQITLWESLFDHSFVNKHSLHSRKEKILGLKTIYENSS